MIISYIFVISYNITGAYNMMGGLWDSISDRQEDGQFGQGQFAFNPIALLTDPSSAIVEADNFIGFQLAPAAVLPVAIFAYFLLFRGPILGFIDGIISKFAKIT